MSQLKILFHLSGSIACFKACEAISRLVQMGHHLQCIASPAALQFVGTATLEGLTGRRVRTAVFEDGSMMDHIALSRWADMLVICPASACTVSRLANGLADDLLGTVFLALPPDRRRILFPAMNSQMLEHPLTQRALKQLTSLGVEVMATGEGRLACGETGSGRLLEADAIVDAIIGSRKRRVVITAGGTREPLDSVRCITNGSSGRTAAAIADAFARRGDKVTYLHAEGAVLPSCSVRRIDFTTSADLQEVLFEELADPAVDILIHSAAVSDFQVAGVSERGVPVGERRKLRSGVGLTVELQPAPKLIGQVRARAANPRLKVVAFKLTSGASPHERLEAVRRLSSEADPDLVVHNDLSEIDGENHLSTLYRIGSCLVACKTKSELANALAGGEWL